MSPFQNKVVLLVDDDVDFLTAMRLQFEAAGFKVLPAEGQHQAEELLKNTRPDVAVVDLMMEHSDGGFSLCHHIKKSDASIPVIIVTGVPSEMGIEFDAATDEERSWVKADAFLAKPVRFEQLFTTIERLMKVTV